MPSPHKHLPAPRSRLQSIGLLICVICLGTAGLLYTRGVPVSPEAQHRANPTASPRDPDLDDSPGPGQYRRVLNVDAELTHADQLTSVAPPAQPAASVAHRWQQTAEDSYQKGLQRRHQGLQQLINAPFNPWDILRGVYIWVARTTNL